MALIPCPNCGQPVSDKAVRCPNCNQPLTPVQSGAQPYSQPAQPTQPMQPQPASPNPATKRPVQTGKDNGKALPIIIVSAAVIIISVIAYFVFLYNSNKNPVVVWEDDDTTVTTSVEETPETYDSGYSEQDLSEVVREANEEMPLIVEEGLRCDEVILEGNYVIYIYSVDESMYSIRDLKESHRELKNIIKNNLKNSTDEGQKQLCAMCKSNQKGLAFRYVGDETGQTHTVYIGPDEL